jgi:DNA-binding transcriptional LysR family regulator
MGELADSAMVAVHLGEVRRLVVAAPRYLKQNPGIKEPSDITRHKIITMAHVPHSWTFPPPAGSSAPRTVQFAPRLVINSVRAAVTSAVGGHGVARLFSYHVAEHLRAGELEVLLREHEPAPLPVHLVAPHGRLAAPRVRAFMDFATPRLRKYFDSLSKDLG